MLKESIRNKVAFGGGKLSVMPTLRSALQILETALDNGISHFDTAPAYGSGYSEKLLESLQETGGIRYLLLLNSAWMLQRSTHYLHLLLYH